MSSFRALLVTATVLASGTALAEDGKPYTALPAETGQTVTPAPELLAAAEALRDAAAAKDTAAVAALVAERLVFVDAGITLDVPRRAETKGPFADAGATLAAIGLAFTEGEPLLPDGKPFDATKSRIATAHATIVELIDGARWGRDPLVAGAVCTAPGAKWDAKAAKKARLGGTRGGFVAAETKVMSEPGGDGARPIGTLKPGFLYATGGDEENGFLAARLPSGKAGWFPVEAGYGATAWGLCFNPDGRGWRMSAVLSALN